ncbi:MAG: molybdopterin-dependent oxidoreductase [Firmicutes bacterium]|nr:molybdopterin-dependent oxidoreductase [Bacillota bacterium]
MAEFKTITKPVMKKDAMQLVTGKPVYTDDIINQDCLIVKLLRSPHASAIIESIDTKIAQKVPGIEAIYTYKDVPQVRFSNAGQTFPEASPYDHQILDQRVRYVGEPVAIIAGESEAACLKAMKLIKVKYQVLEPVFDMHTAKDNPILVHPEENWRTLSYDFYKSDNKRNLVSHEEDSHGDLEKAFAECDEIVEHTYHCKANQQAMMETFRTYCEIDTYGRLHVISSTQIIYHVRRIVSNALQIPKSKVRVTKPRIGGGFGAKQTSISEVYPAFVTWMTKKPSKIIFTRKECQIAGSPRHEMEMKIRVGATKDGHIKAIDLYVLSNSGAYGDHGPTTVGLAGHKSIPLYTGGMEAHRFTADVVYTNIQSAGAFRGYGAPQGIFALESAVNELAAKLNIDPIKIREMNMLKEGMHMDAYFHEDATACALDRCMEKAKEMFDWDNKPDCVDLGNGKVRSKGVAMAMQGSCISNLDVGSATVRLTEDGGYLLVIGAADMGTGCDTVLSQILAECMDCDVDDVEVMSADTDFSPYDSGSYASSTTYITGMATYKAGMKLKEQILKISALKLNKPIEELTMESKEVVAPDGQSISLVDIATASMCFNDIPTTVTETHTSPVSPPPYMVGMVEIELDKETGEVEVKDYVGVVDCGTVMNENLARVQTEGGIVQGIGMALMENVTYTKKGAIFEESLMNYKIPTRLDMGVLRTAFESSYEESGPYGAKSIGELVIDTPCPAINHAIYNAIGKFLYEVPFTPEKIVMAQDE